MAHISNSYIISGSRKRFAYFLCVRTEFMCYLRKDFDCSTLDKYTFMLECSEHKPRLPCVGVCVCLLQFNDVCVHSPLSRRRGRHCCVGVVLDELRALVKHRVQRENVLSGMNVDVAMSFLCACGELLHCSLKFTPNRTCCQRQMSYTCVKMSHQRTIHIRTEAVFSQSVFVNNCR